MDFSGVCINTSAVPAAACRSTTFFCLFFLAWPSLNFAPQNIYCCYWRCCLANNTATALPSSPEAQTSCGCTTTSLPASTNINIFRVWCFTNDGSHFINWACFTLMTFSHSAALAFRIGIWKMLEWTNREWKQKSIFPSTYQPTSRGATQTRRTLTHHTERPVVISVDRTGVAKELWLFSPVASCWSYG